MIEIVDYRPEMRKGFKPREGDEILPDMIDKVRYLGMPHKAVGFYWNDDLLTVACMFEEHSGMWNLIMGFRQDALDKPMSKKTRQLVIALKAMLNITYHREKISRLQAYIKAGCPKHLRFAEWAGFERSGFLEKWGPDGSDYYLYARVKR